MENGPQPKLLLSLINLKYRPNFAPIRWNYPKPVVSKCHLERCFTDARETLSKDRHLNFPSNERVFFILGLQPFYIFSVKMPICENVMYTCVWKGPTINPQTPRTTISFNIRGSRHTQSVTQNNHIYAFMKNRAYTCNFLKKGHHISSKPEASFVRFFLYFKCKLFRNRYNTRSSLVTKRSITPCY